MAVVYYQRYKPLTKSTDLSLLNFFLLGGHSLLVMRALAAYKQNFSVSLSAKTFFENPILKEQAKLIEALIGDTNFDDEEETASLAVVNKHDVSFSLQSFAQQRIWFLQELNPESKEFHIAFSLDLPDGINLESFEQAIKTVLNRHEILRSCFYYDSDTENCLYKLAFSSEDILCDEQFDIYKFFDLKLEPALRIQIKSNRASSKLELNLCVHHILADAWSAELIYKECLQAYFGNTLNEGTSYKDFVNWQFSYLEGEKAKQDEQYWNAQLAKYEDLHLLNYKKDSEKDSSDSQLGHGQIDFEIPKEVIFDIQLFCRENSVSEFVFFFTCFEFVLARYSGQDNFVIGTPVNLRDEERWQQCVGPFINILPLIANYKEEYSITEYLSQVQASLLDAQEHKHYPIEKIIELLSPERKKQGSPLFQNLFSFNQRVFSRKEVDLSVGLGIDEKGVAERRIDELGLEESLFPKPSSFTTASKYELSFELIPKKTGYRALVSYWSKHIDARLVKQLSQHYLRAVKLFAGKGDVSVSQLDLLSKNERKAMLHWSKGLALRTNKTRDENNKPNTLLDAFHFNVENCGDKIALRYSQKGDEYQLSYQELNKKVEHLSQALLKNIEQGLEASDGFQESKSKLKLKLKQKQRQKRIAFLCSRESQSQINSILLMLAANKLSICFIPVDGEAPLSRLNLILKTAEADLLLNTTSHTIEGLEQPIIKVEDLLNTDYTGGNGVREKTVLDQYESEENEQLAYIIFTSGSTGIPKGVKVGNDSLNNYLLWADTFYQTHSLSASLVHLPAYFDASFTSSLLGLYAGLNLRIVDSEDDFIDSLINSSDENYLIKLTPSHLDFYSGVLAERNEKERDYKQRQEAANNEAQASHQFIIGGEKLYSKQVKTWAQLFRNSNFINEYGPTEATIACSVESYSSEEILNMNSNSTLVIGKAIGGAQLFVLDKEKRLAPLGVEGDLYIGGQVLAKGYLEGTDIGEKEGAGLEAEKNQFVENINLPGLGRQALYPSGDRVIRDGKGKLIFVGRNDEQIKIRGFRVELEEIKKRIEEVEGVKQAVLMPSDSNSDTGEQKLIQALWCYLQLDFVELSAALITDVRSHLKNTLPEYMQPSQYFLVEEISIKANGKRDDAALRKNAIHVDKHLKEVQAPSKALNASEKTMQSIWAEVLQYESSSQEGSLPDIDKDFFELGGHSLLAVKIIEKINRQFNCDIRIKTLFSGATIRSLAKLVDSEAFEEAQVIPIYSREQALLPSFEQERMWFLQKLHPESSTYVLDFRQSVVCPKNQQEALLVNLQRALHYLVAKHEVLRSHFFWDEDHLGLDLLAIDAFAIERFSNAQAFNQRIQQSFDVDNEALLRVVTLSKEESIHIHFSIHHAISDGWTMNILRNDLFAFLAGKVDLENQERDALQARNLQYADYAMWQRKTNNESALQEEQRFWKDYINTDYSRLQLPFKKITPLSRKESFERVDTQLNEAQIKTASNLLQKSGY